LILCELLQTEDLVLQKLMNKFTCMGPGQGSVKVHVRHLNWLCIRTMGTNKHMCLKVMIDVSKISFDAGV